MDRGEQPREFLRLDAAVGRRQCGRHLLLLPVAAAAAAAAGRGAVVAQAVAAFAQQRAQRLGAIQPLVCLLGLRLPGGVQSSCRYKAQCTAIRALQLNAAAEAAGGGVRRRGGGGEGGGGREGARGAALGWCARVHALAARPTPRLHRPAASGRRRLHSVGVQLASHDAAERRGIGGLLLLFLLLFLLRVLVPAAVAVEIAGFPFRSLRLHRRALLRAADVQHIHAQPCVIALLPPAIVVVVAFVAVAIARAGGGGAQASALRHGDRQRLQRPRCCRSAVGLRAMEVRRAPHDEMPPRSNGSPAGARQSAGQHRRNWWSDSR